MEKNMVCFNPYPAFIAGFVLVLLGCILPVYARHKRMKKGPVSKRNELFDLLWVSMLIGGVILMALVAGDVASYGDCV